MIDTLLARCGRTLSVAAAVAAGFLAMSAPAPANAAQVTIMAAGNGEPDPDGLARAQLLVQRYGALGLAGLEFELEMDPSNGAARRTGEAVRALLDAQASPAWLSTRHMMAGRPGVIGVLSARASSQIVARACPFQVSIQEQLIFDDAHTRLLMPAPPPGANLPLPMRGSIVTVIPARPGLAGPALVMETAQGFSALTALRVTSADVAFGAWARAHLFWDLAEPMPDLARVQPEAASRRLSGLAQRFAPAGPWGSARRDILLPLPHTIDPAAGLDTGYCYIDFVAPQ
jgi:hypothetical protein